MAIKKVAIIVPLIGISLIIVRSGLTNLVYYTTEIAVGRALFGTEFMMLVDMEVSVMTFYRGFGKQELGS